MTMNIKRRICIPWRRHQLISGCLNIFDLKSYLTAEIRSTCLRQLRSVINLPKSGTSHPDLSGSRIKKEEKAIQAVLDLLENTWINPFDDRVTDLPSGIAAPKDVTSELLAAEVRGKAEYGKFIEDRLTKGVSFYDRLPKLKLKTFGSMRVTKKTKINNSDNS